MPCLVSGGKISAVIFETYAEVKATFLVAPPFDGEVVIPFIPDGTVYNLKVIKDGKEILETGAVNIREFNACPAKNSVIVSKRLDGCLVLRLNELLAESVVEVEIGSVSYPEKTDNRISLTFPSGVGDAVFMKVIAETSANVLKVASPTHKISTAMSEKKWVTEADVNVNGESFTLDVFYEEKNEAWAVVSRRMFGDNVAFCSFVPKLSGKQNEFVIQPIGGICTKIFGDVIPSSEQRMHCFIVHRIVPPKGIKIISRDGKYEEDIYFDTTETKLMYMPVEILYARERIAVLEEMLKTSPPEERCVIREEINDICRATNIVMGDVALVGISDKQIAGLITLGGKRNIDGFRFMNESTEIDSEKVVEQILNSQTTDGVIAELSETDEDIFVFSTAVCLIALYLYTGDTYKKFAKRSVDFLENKNGYWSETAIKLWTGESVGMDELSERAEMKIMYQRLDELAVCLIKNFRRKEK